MIHRSPTFAANEGFIREYAVEYGYFRGDRDLQWSQKLDPNRLTREQFLRARRRERGKSRLEPSHSAN